MMVFRLCANLWHRCRTFTNDTVSVHTSEKYVKIRIYPHIRGRRRTSVYRLLEEVDGGDAGIRTLDTALGPYNGLANRRLQPLGHVSVKADKHLARTLSEQTGDIGRDRLPPTQGRPLSNNGCSRSRRHRADGFGHEQTCEKFEGLNLVSLPERGLRAQDDFDQGRSIAKPAVSPGRTECATCAFPRRPTRGAAHP